MISGTLTKVGPGRAFAFRGPLNVTIWASYISALTTTAASLSSSIAAAGVVAAGSAINSADVPPGTTVGALSGTTITLALPVETLYGNINSAGAISGLASTAGLLGATVTVPSNAEQVTLPAGATVTAIVQAAIPRTNDNPFGRPGTVQLSAPPTTIPPNNPPVPFDFALTSNSVTTGVDAAASFTGASILWTGTVQLESSFDGGFTWIPCTFSTGTLVSYSAGTPVRLTFGEPEKQVLYRLNALAYTAVAGTTLNYRISQTGGAAESLAIGSLI